MQEKINLLVFTTTKYKNLFEFEEKAQIGSRQVFKGKTYYKVFLKEEDDLATLTYKQLKERFDIY